jgi:DNA topoisomerase I
VPSPRVPETIDPAVAARAARLRYVNDGEPGFTRVRRGRSFSYRRPNGSAVRDARALARIRALAVPPAWTDVWICADEHGHIQATGRDARGRKQYRYHPRWRSVRDETKYDRMLAFARALPSIRARVARDMRRPGLPREKVLATVVKLLEMTLVRVGNEEYARHNGSYGLTTLKDRHVDIRAGRLRFRFRGKAGKAHEIELDDPRLARIVKRCRDVPGQELFQYVDDDGRAFSVGSSDVNAYLRELGGDEFTAKDFRTWAGTVLAAVALAELAPFESQRQAKRNIVGAIERVAARLGNTVAICRKCYVHPAIFEAYLEKALATSLAQRARRNARQALSRDEAAVLALLQRRLAGRRQDVKTLLARSIARARRERGGRRAA